jgi:23S rRNA maturation-related 3'-5' exoribonuclease YhaM
MTTSRRPSARFEGPDRPLTSSEHDAATAARVAEHRAAVASSRQRVLEYMRRLEREEAYSVEVAADLGFKLGFTRSVLMELERRGHLVSACSRRCQRRSARFREQRLRRAS